MPSDPVITAIDLCAGAGGWACAARGLPIRIALAVDVWHAAAMTYGLNQPDTEIWEKDLRDSGVQNDLAAAFAGRCDLVLGGIPCEWLSIRRNVGNGVSETEFADQRRTLSAVLSLVERLRPRWWCLEDVAALVRELPPGTPSIVLDSANYSAQRRRRVYVGQFPRPPGFGPLVGESCRRIIADHLRPGPYRIGRRTHGRTATNCDTFAPDKCYGIALADKAATICCISSRRDPEYVILDPSVPGGMRQLEWQEAASLQGFPPDYLFYGSPGDCWTQIGRAVQIDTARVILQGIVQAWRPAAPSSGALASGALASGVSS